MKRRMRQAVAILALAMVAGCKNEDTASNSNTAPPPREIPKFSENTSAPATQPSGMTAATRSADNMPNDAIHAALRPGEDIVPRFEPPIDWQPKPARSMTDQVFALPKADGDSEDGDLAISHLAQHIPMQGNVQRWCGFFGYSSQECEQHMKKQELQGTKYPTVVVDISGTYKGSAMMGPSGPPKENYRMLVAEVKTPQQPYYVRLTGPKNTVARWEEAYMKMLRAAK